MLKFLSFLLLAASALYGQTPIGYVLAKTGVSTQSSPGSINFQWVASNNTSKSGNFFILENVPGRCEIQSIVEETTATLNPSLPLSGPAALTIGPFPINANSSVTFQVTEIIQGSPTQGQNRSVAGETFSLLSQSQLAGKNPQSLIAALSVNRSGTPASDTTTGSSGRLIQSAAAAPNISNGNQPINFILNLTSPSLVHLSLFTVAGELVFDTQAQEGQGSSTISWNIQNNTRQQVASGLYIYLLKVDGAGTEETKVGKVLVIH